MAKNFAPSATGGDKKQRRAGKAHARSEAKQRRAKATAKAVAKKGAGVALATAAAVAAVKGPKPAATTAVVTVHPSSGKNVAPSSNWELLKASVSGGPASKAPKGGRQVQKATGPLPDRMKRRVSRPGESGADLKRARAAEEAQTVQLFYPNADRGPTKYVAMDCEMVGVGPDGVQSELARVSIVNYYGHVLLDTYVKPIAKVTDYRTFVSGIRPKHLFNAPAFKDVARQVAQILDGKIVVGHALSNDWKALLLDHPRSMIRDTAKYKPLRGPSGRPQKLKNLVTKHTGQAIQSGEHSSVEDSRGVMAVFKVHQREWERSLVDGKSGKKAAKKVAPAGDDA